MQVVVLTGSAHRKGMSALLAEKFMEGAEEAGHEVVRIDTAFKHVHYCLGRFKRREENSIRAVPNYTKGIG